jgi:hypothetical protein
MDEREERAAKDAPPDSDTFHEGVLIEGLRPPLTLEQRRRRAAVVTLVLVGALAILLWPAISSRGVFSAIRSAPAPAASATRSVFTWRMQGGATVVSGNSPGISDNPSVMCPVTPQSLSSVGAPETHADSIGNGDVWALLLSGAQIVVGQDTNIVWRATGAGTLDVTARGPGNTSLWPTFAPNPHSGSNWERPGDEWGTIFNFPMAGCWQLQVTRGIDLHASVWLTVRA